MDLRAKLARLRNSPPPEALFAPEPAANFEPGALHSGKSERIAQLRALISEVAARQRLRPPEAARSVHAAPPWPSEETEHGRLYTCLRHLEPHHHHGSAPVLAGARSQAGTIAALLRDAALCDLDLRHALYLDTETTGLASGTGTVAFLIGLARFDDQALCVEQLIVPQLGAERPVLARLAERLAAASCVVSYNGKSFDWPLLKTRFVLARLPVPALPPHIDLLHLSRSLWRERMDTVRLADVEREILRFERVHDINGDEIPDRYFEYLRGGDSQRLAPVLEHNQNDVIALPALLGAIIGRYEASVPEHDALAFARISWRARDRERALHFARAALANAVAAEEQRRALLLCGEVERKSGDVREAIALLEQANALQSEAAVHCALAKLYEHACNDFARALQHARHTEACEGPERHGRRMGRLYRRLLRRDRSRAPGVEP